MSTTSERSMTEQTVDLPHQPLVYNSSPIRHTSNPLKYDRKSIQLASPIYLRRVRPNKRFFRADSAPDERVLRLNFYSDETSDQEREGKAERPRNLLSRQAAEVAAAARFISKVDVTVPDATLASAPTPSRPRLGSITRLRDSVLDSSLSVPRTRQAKMEAHSFSKRTRIAIPPPLQFIRPGAGTEDIQSPLPTRTSSRGAPSFDIARPPGSAKSFSRHTISPRRDSYPKTSLPVLTPESANTFHFDFSVPSEPQLSRSGSGATADSDSPPTPIDGPSEEQIRRDIEVFASEQGPYLRGSQRRLRRLPTMDAEADSRLHEPILPLLPETDECPESPPADNEVFDVPGYFQDHESDSSPALRRKKSIFGWLQKKSEVDVDELIDLYLTDEQREEVKITERKASRSRLNAFRGRVTPPPPPMNTG